MKRGWITLLLIGVVTMFLVGCSSPMKEAKTMMDSGQYEQLIAKFKDNPELAAVVQQAKDKLVEKMFGEGKYNAIVEMYPDHRMAKDAKNKLAEALLAEGKLDEVIAKYPESPAAMQAKLKMQEMLTDSMAAVADSANQKLTESEKKVKDTQKKVEQVKDDAAQMAEAAAEKELNRIMGIKVPALKKKSLQTFVDNPDFKKTAAHKKAVEELAKL
ncbi:MAG: hypothetical protein H6508_01045 [Calditrichaeota bacterium]|nr:hypothetical protein [Calditrichota bacterium]MCB9365762.1 hypothetical protein [Calditrichota bacterium]